MIDVVRVVSKEISNEFDGDIEVRSSWWNARPSGLSFERGKVYVYLTFSIDKSNIVTATDDSGDVALPVNVKMIDSYQGKLVVIVLDKYGVQSSDIWEHANAVKSILLTPSATMNFREYGFDIHDGSGAMNDRSFVEGSEGMRRVDFDVFVSGHTIYKKKYNVIESVTLGEVLTDRR